MRNAAGSDPARFALGVAIPLDAARWATRRDGQPRDLARLLGTPSEDFFDRLRTAVTLSETSGVGRIVVDLSARELPTLFADSDVVVLWAHGPAPGLIELDDGVLDVDGFLARMPPFSGCLDLTTCFSEELANPIRFARGCIVAGRAGTVKLGHALMLYLQTLAGVLEEQRPYCDVMADLLVEWVETR